MAVIDQPRSSSPAARRQEVDLGSPGPVDGRYRQQARRAHGARRYGKLPVVADDRRELREAVDAIRWYHRSISAAGSSPRRRAPPSGSRVWIYRIDLRGQRCSTSARGTVLLLRMPSGAGRACRRGRLYSWHGDGTGHQGGLQAGPAHARIGRRGRRRRRDGPVAGGGRRRSTWCCSLACSITCAIRCLALDGSLGRRSRATADPRDARRPGWAPAAGGGVLPAGDLNGDPTNWWGPNIPAVVEMLRAVGFDETDVRHPRSAALRRHQDGACAWLSPRATASGAAPRTSRRRRAGRSCTRVGRGASAARKTTRTETGVAVPRSISSSGAVSNVAISPSGGPAHLAPARLASACRARGWAGRRPTRRPDAERVADPQRGAVAVAARKRREAAEALAGAPQGEPGHERRGKAPG